MRRKLRDAPPQGTLWHRLSSGEAPVSPFIERDGCPNYIDSVEEGLCNVLKEQRQGSIVKESGNSRTR